MDELENAEAYEKQQAAAALGWISVHLDHVDDASQRFEQSKQIWEDFWAAETEDLGIIENMILESFDADTLPNLEMDLVIAHLQNNKSDYIRALSELKSSYPGLDIAEYVSSYSTMKDEFIGITKLEYKYIHEAFEQRESWHTLSDLSIEH